MNHKRKLRHVFALAVMLLLFLGVPSAHARWHWGELKAFSVHLVCQDGIIATVGSEPAAPNPTQMQLYIYTENPIREIQSPVLTLAQRAVPRYAPPDPIYQPYNPYRPAGMFMYYYRTWVIKWAELLPVGTRIEIDYTNSANLTRWQIYPVQDCLVDHAKFGNATITWRHRATGEIRQYLVSVINGSLNVANNTLFAEPDRNWTIVGSGDYNGDVQTDLMWHHIPSDTTALQILNGLGVLHTFPGFLIAPTINVVGNGDYSGDGPDDILARNYSSGELYVTIFDRDEVVNLPVMVGSEPDPRWRVVGSGDFDANGTADVFWRHSVTGALKVWLFNPFASGPSELFLAAQSPRNWAVAGIADFDGNDHTDILWLDQQTEDVYLWLASATNKELTLKSLQYPEIAHQLLHAQETTSLAWQVINTSDFNGDGRADILWYNATTSALYLWLLNGPTVVGELPVPSPVGQGWEAINATDTAGDVPVALNFLPLSAP